MNFVTTNTPVFVKRSFAKGRYSGLSLSMLYKVLVTVQCTTDPTEADGRLVTGDEIFYFQ